MKSLLALLALALLVPALLAAPLKPFTAAQIPTQKNLDEASLAVESAMTNGGFEKVGEYSPYPTTQILVFTNETLKDLATASEKGGFGAMLRVSVTDHEGAIQIAYTTPEYWYNAYHLQGDLTSVTEAITKALGKGQAFGPKNGLEPEELREYHYKFGMPYFSDTLLLADHEDYQTALNTVEKGLQNKAGGVSKVYRIDLPDKEETVFGVAMTQKVSSDVFIMKEVDFKEMRSSAHLPYEILVSKGKVYTLPAEFRIAISFPDLSMMGANSFMNIMSAPGDIADALKAVAKGK